MTFSPFDIVIGVTGHRDILPGDEQAIEDEFGRLIDTLTSELQDAGKRSWSERIPALWERKHEVSVSFRVLIGMATGADQLIARACFKLIEKGLPITPVAVYPMPLEDYRDDFPDAAAFDELDQKLRDGGYTIIELPAPSDPTRRDQCYAKLGLYLADKADLVVAIWDAHGVRNPDFTPLAGGTEFIVRHARDPSYRFKHPAAAGNQELHADISGHLYNPDGLPVYRIPAGRESTGPVEPGAEAGFITELGKGRISVSPSLPELSYELFKRVQQLKERIPAPVEAHKYRVCETLKSEIDAVRDLDSLAVAYAQFDFEAGRLQKWSKGVRLGVTGGTAVLTFLFLFYSIVPSYWWLVAYAALFTVGLILYGLVKPKVLNANQALLRAAAESLRVEFFWRALGIIDAAGHNSLARKLPGQDSEGTRLVGTLLKRTTLLGREATTATISADTGVDVWLKNQASYYERKQSAYHSLEQGLHKKVWWLGIILPSLFCMLLVCFYVGLQSLPLGMGRLSLKDALVFLIAFLPVFAAAAGLYASSAAWAELATQYATTRGYLARTKTLLDARQAESLSPESCSDEQAFSNAVFVVAGVHLSQEHMQWLATMQNRVPHPAHGG